MNTDLHKHHIDILVRAAYVAAQSAPDAKRYVFAYTVTITNSGSVPAKLLNRHWVITDGNEQVQEVRGVGVVGEQPHLSPGMSFECTSGTVLETPIGTMQGSYQMLAAAGPAVFDVHLEQPPGGDVHGGFPQLFRIHFTQTLVALNGLAAARLLHEPLEGLVEARHRLGLVAPRHGRAFLDQAMP